jgi:ketosteroid isomerase-like protein
MEIRRISIAIAAALAALILTAVSTPRACAQASANQQQVLDMQKKFQESSVGGDTDGVAALMADDAIFIHGNGAAQSKPEFIAAMKASQLALSLYDLKDPKVVMFNGGAIVSGLVDIAFKAPGGSTAPPRVLHMRGSSVWLQTSAGWKLTLDQDTTLAGPPASAPPPPPVH